MRPLLYGLTLSLVVLTNCKPQEDSTPQFTFKGQILNATTNEVPVGLSVTLQATSSPDLFTKFKKEILGTAITDSMGRFSITYKKTSLPILTLLSQFLTYNDLPINKNVDTIFYRSTKGTISFILTAINPLKIEDTLYLAIPALDIGKDVTFEKISGPFPQKKIIQYRTLTDRGSLQYFWAIGYTQWDSVMRFSHLYSKNKLIYNMRGDPYIDTIKIKYR